MLLDSLIRRAGEIGLRECDFEWNGAASPSGHFFTLSTFSLTPSRVKAIERPFPQPIKGVSAMPMDLKNMSVAELEQLISDAGARIEVVKRHQYSQLRRSLEAQARDAGFDVYELFGLDGTKGRKRVAASTYRNPKNPEQTWAGVGKRPEWIRAAINAGETLESMRIA
jgi:DNA-binding protein H-NS